jgi:hypothetical protein
MAGERPTGLVPLTSFRRRAKDAVRRVPKFWFIGAERGAPVEVRMAIARFRQLPEKVRGQMVLWGWLGGPGMTPKMKFEPNEVNFGPPPAGKAFERCGGCNHFFTHHPTGVTICAIVKTAPISPLAWCSKYVPAISAKAFIKYQDGNG